MIALTAAALGLRLYRLGHEPLWFDEGYTAITAVKPVTELLARLRREVSAPLYYLVLHGWAAVVGDDEFRLRLLSALVGTATVPLLYCVGACMFSPAAGLVAAALATVSPLHVHYSQELRMYAMVPPLAVGLLGGLHRLLLAPSAPALAAVVLCSVAGLYLHYYFLFLLPLLGAALVAPGGRRAIGFAAAALLLVGVGFLPWLPAFLNQAGGGGANDWIRTWWHGRPLWYAPIWSLEVLGPGARYPMANFKLASSTAARAISLGLAAVVIGGALVQAWRARGNASAFALGLTLAAVVTPLVLALGVSLAGTPLYVVARYDLIAWGAYYLLAGAVLSRLPIPVAGVAVGLWVGVSVFTLVPYFITDRPRVVYANLGDVMARTLRAQARAGEMVVFPAGTRPTTEYNLRDIADRFRLVSYPLGTDDHLGWIDARIGSDPALAASEARRFVAWLKESSPAPDVVWVAAPRTQGTPPLIAELERLGYQRDGGRSSEHVVCLLRM